VCFRSQKSIPCPLPNTATLLPEGARILSTPALRISAQNPENRVTARRLALATRFLGTQTMAVSSASAPGASSDTTQGGYGYRFVNTPPDRVVCVICHLPSRDCRLSECCGHVFCKSCLDETKALGYSACPMCKEIKFVTFSNKQIDREVKSLHVFCTNKEKGCDWQGELNDIKSHLGGSNSCGFGEVKCPNECGKMLNSESLTRHAEAECPRRKVDCQFCKDSGEHQFITSSQHKDYCPRLPLRCPNKCKVKGVPREDMEAHRKDCPLEIIRCEYYNIGCKETMIRRKRKKHDEDHMEDHLHMVKRRLIETSLMDTMLQHLTRSIGSDDRLITSAKWMLHITSMATLLVSGAQICPVIVKMMEFSHYKSNAYEWFSAPFYSHDGGYKLCFSINPSGSGEGKDSHLSAFIFLMRGPHDDELSWPMRERFEIKLLNQVSDGDHCVLTCSFDDTVPSSISGKVVSASRAEVGWGYPKFISIDDLSKTTHDCRYLRNDCVFFQIHKL